MPSKHTLFVHLRGPADSAANWRLCTHHTLALVAHAAKQYGNVVQCSFPRSNGRLLGYGTITFRDKISAWSMLCDAHDRPGYIEVGHLPPEPKPDKIAYTSLADAEKAWKVVPTRMHMFRSTDPISLRARAGYVCFLVNADRQHTRIPRKYKPSRMHSLLSRFGGFAGRLKLPGNESEAREDQEDD
ncbi:hypothetical protein MYAM1_002919 [Malassezia yamatoensis]|uniref:RRM domain-containing protein n=1 Tax=Malassezia yamatoensis TaxID=253288 RepID=A0AAJ5YUV3_9BASI|nr:hypothetical protein MYAM1_002919 [Malassezia yamatoensis]